VLLDLEKAGSAAITASLDLYPELCPPDLAFHQY
jgi:hypothetical protein